MITNDEVARCLEDMILEMSLISMRREAAFYGPILVVTLASLSTAGG